MLFPRSACILRRDDTYIYTHTYSMYIHSFIPVVRNENVLLFIIKFIKKKKKSTHDVRHVPLTPDQQTQGALDY